MSDLKRIYYTADEISELLGISTGTSYRIIRGLNNVNYSLSYLWIIKLSHHW